jgi:hypothetical protein
VIGVETMDIRTGPAAAPSVFPGLFQIDRGACSYLDVAVAPA